MKDQGSSTPSSYDAQQPLTVSDGQWQQGGAPVYGNSAQTMDSAPPAPAMQPTDQPQQNQSMMQTGAGGLGINPQTLKIVQQLMQRAPVQQSANPQPVGSGGYQNGPPPQAPAAPQKAQNPISPALLQGMMGAMG